MKNLADITEYFSELEDYTECPLCDQPMASDEGYLVFDHHNDTECVVCLDCYETRDKE